MIESPYAGEELRGTYERLVKHELSMGREVPRSPVYLSSDKQSSDYNDYVKQSVASSQELCRHATSKTFAWNPDAWLRIFSKKG